MVDKRETIGFDDFLKLDIRVGTVVKAEPYPEARALWAHSSPVPGSGPAPAKA